MKGSYTYAQAKAAMRAEGYNVTEGDAWFGPDQAQFEIFVLEKGFKAHRDGANPDDPYGVRAAHDGFAFDIAPVWLKEIILECASSATPDAE